MIMIVKGGSRFARLALMCCVVWAVTPSTFLRMVCVCGCVGVGPHPHFKLPMNVHCLRFCVIGLLRGPVEEPEVTWTEVRARSLGLAAPSPAGRCCTAMAMAGAARCEWRASCVRHVPAA